MFLVSFGFEQYLLENYFAPKKPGSIKYQFNNPASMPMANTTIAITLSAVVSGFPTLFGNNSKNNPPTMQTGVKAASLKEYFPSPLSWFQL